MMATEIDAGDLAEMATRIVTPSPVFTEWTVGELEIPCDYAETDIICPDRPARWVMFVEDHGCGSYVKLACDSCKAFRMTSEAAVECVRCDHVTIPARHAYSRVEAL
jgi:hypothetical protein